MINCMMNVRSVWVWPMIFLFTLSGCSTMTKYKAVTNPIELNVSFADPAWNGKRVPQGQQCGRDDGKGGTPPITVHNIPTEANAIIMEFSDATASHMDNGGHGIIGYRILNNPGSLTIPSAPGHTFDLPTGFFKVAAHSAPSWDTAGAYLPPCSGGTGNTYYVTVRAVYDAPKGKQSKMLGKAVLQMGTY